MSMKKTSDFRFWSRIGTGIFCLIVMAFFYIKAAIIKPEVSISRFDTNASGVPDLIRVYFDGQLQRELIDFTWNDVYTYRIYWTESGAVKRIERMLDVKKWLYEYYNEPVKLYENYFVQDLDYERTFNRQRKYLAGEIPYANVKLFIARNHIFAAEYFENGASDPFIVAFYDKYGRFSEIYRDLNNDGLSDDKIIYEGGVMVARIKDNTKISFDRYKYMYGEN